MRIKKVSSKREIDNQEYLEVKIKKKADLILAKKWVGVFSNQPIPQNILPGFHHMEGKIGFLLTDYHNVMPIQNEAYHFAYHHWDINKLIKLAWYNAFLQRVKHTHKNVFNTELKRMNKANLITDEEYLSLWVD